MNLIRETIPAKEPYSENRLLNPIERITEILFGLVMALSFTCAISVAESSHADVRQMLFGAIGCNIAWGVIDAIMCLMIVLAQRGRDMAVIRYISNTPDEKKARELIAEAISPELAAIMETQSFENIRKDIVRTGPNISHPRIFLKDLKTALGIFLLVFLSTFPIAIPFAFIKDVRIALRISNGIAILLLFIGGWILARYSTYNKFRTGLYLALIGIGMVFLTISLGG
jgi:VIT1/CCC1 family predicted Fe2+/Mn2+ transporter